MHPRGTEFAKIVFYSSPSAFSAPSRCAPCHAQGSGIKLAPKYIFLKIRRDGSLFPKLWSDTRFALSLRSRLLMRNARLASSIHLAHSLLRSVTESQCDRKRRIQLNTSVAVATPLAATSCGKETAPSKKAYKSVPENYRVLSDAKFHKVVADLEAILLDISADGIGINTPDGRISASTLNSWAESLRNALETLSKAQ